MEWIESCFAGEYCNGTQEEVMSQIESNTKLSEYMNPTETMLFPPPPSFNSSEPHSSSECMTCVKSSTGWEYFGLTVDDLLTKSNIHNCNRNQNKDGSVDKKHAYTGCMDNKWGKCKARFPRALLDQTMVNKETGSLDMEKESR